MIYNLNENNIDSYLRMGDILAILKRLHYDRSYYNLTDATWYISDSLLVDEKGQFVQYRKDLIEWLHYNTDYLSLEPGLVDYPHQICITDMLFWWGFSVAPGLLKINNFQAMKQKICIFPLLTAIYNIERNWSMSLYQSIIDSYSTDMFQGYEKIICIEHDHPTGIDLKDFTISKDFNSNLNHLLDCEYYIGGDTGFSHLAGALNKPERKKFYYFCRGHHGMWPSYMTVPSNGNGTVIYYD